LAKKIHPLWGGIWCTDAVTPLSMHTYEVARGSAEAAMTGAELLRSGEQSEVYALCRPSGHHAGPRVFGGYCYFNNVAAAADILCRTGRVAILDIDYHHGNGTQEFFQERKDVLTCSIHADPDREYPYFWGYVEERGVGQAKGTNLNFPLRLGTTDDQYLEALDRAIDAIRAYASDFLILAAGFDTYAEDPIGGFALTVEVYPELGRRLGEMGLPTLICQEGGYNTDVLGECVRGLLTGFLDGR
jgi:acetoin utilization deacetylase AcuC-like enzyme